MQLSEAKAALLGGMGLKEHQWIESRGKRLSVMIHRAEGVEKAPVVVLCHGFTGDKVGVNQYILHLAKTIEAAGFTAVRFDFAGSGDSEGEFAEDTIVSGWNEDLRSVVSWISRQPEFKSLPIFLLGHSLGGCVILMYEDKETPIAGRIALAPVMYPVDNFRDTIIGPELWEKALLGKTISNFYNKGFSLNKDFVCDLLEHSYSPLEKAKDYTAPLLIIHGSGDIAVPLKGSQQLYEEYGGEKELLLLENADHVFTGHTRELQSLIVTWLETWT
jgi:alpha-beta hydrolase superfamily lysophospholipase